MYYPLAEEHRVTQAKLFHSTDGNTRLAGRHSNYNPLAGEYRSSLGRGSVAFPYGLILIILQDQREGERHKRVAVTFVELAHELHPERIHNFLNL